MSKKEKAEDYKSSGFILLGVGVIGGGFLILTFFDVISLPFSLNVMTYIVMGILFAVFIVMALVSIGAYKKLMVESVKEEENITLVKEFANKNITRDYINNQLSKATEFSSEDETPSDETLGDEILNDEVLDDVVLDDEQLKESDSQEQFLYFARLEQILEAFAEKFPDMEDSFLEKLADAHYDEIYGRELNE